MKTSLPVLLIMICLFCGCAAGARTEEDYVPQRHTPVSDPGYYDPDSTLESHTNGALRCYPLGFSGTMTLRILSQDRLLVIRSGENASELILLSGPEATVTAAATLPFPLDQEAVQPWEQGISCFDPVARQFLLLDSDLRETGRITIAQEVLGIPLLSRDGTRLYYTTQSGLRVLDRESGISSILRSSANHQAPIALCLQDSALICIESDATGTHTLLICAQTGATLFRSRRDGNIRASEGSIYVDSDDALLFCAPDGPLWELIVDDAPRNAWPLPGSHSAVSISGPDDTGTLLSHYDLSTGLRTGVLQLPPGPQPQDLLAEAGGAVWFWRFDSHYGCNTLYRWDPSGSPSGDTQRYTALSFSREVPDLEGLGKCQEYARQLEKRYGIRILLYLDADDVQPQGYRLEYEYRAWRTMRALELLDGSLCHYPSGFLDKVSEPFQGLTICLVSDIRGSAQWGTLDSMPGLQFLDGNRAYIILSTGSGIQGAMYHQLCHLIDTVVFTHSSAYDTWESLNPSGFQYDYSYTANRSRNSTAYLLEDRRTFVDMFSMSFPKEDRARIMEYAMLPGNGAMFRSSGMQAKLKKLCLGIREAFGLEDSKEVFLWEQYLDKPLAPKA